MIYTSYYANLRNLPNNIIPIGVSIKAPYFVKIICYSKLAPTRDILDEYKKDHNIEKYTEKYNDQVLSNLDPNEVVNELYQVSNGKDVALICYEKYDKFCHRQLIAKWLNNNGIEVKEYMKED